MSEEIKIDEKKIDERLDNIEKYSEFLFNKPSKDIKYILCTNYIHFQLLQEENTRTGLYQWQNVFNGKVDYPHKINYSDYDIIQVNASAQDLHLVSKIKNSLPKDSKTKIVLNNDYTTEMWGMSFEYPETFRLCAEKADMLFGTEYFQTTAFSEITGKKAYIIPHPADVRRLKLLPQISKKNIISTIWRRYDKFSYIPSLAVRNHGVSTQLLGYDKNQDPKTYLTTTLYDTVLMGTNYMDFCNQMRESKIVYNPFTFHSYDRTTVDCAAMKVAVVGSNRTQSCNLLYPFSTCDPYDVKSAREIINKLLTDKEYYDKVVNYAYEQVEFYNHTNSKERYLRALYESVNTKKDSIKIIKNDKIEASVGEDAKMFMAKEKNIKDIKVK